MCDLNWCPVCDKAIPLESDSLYCSLSCLKQDALRTNPLLGYKFEDFQGFLVSPRRRHAFFDKPSPPSSSKTPPTAPSLSPSINFDSEDDEEDEAKTPKQSGCRQQQPNSPPKLDLGRSACLYCEHRTTHPDFLNRRHS